MRRRLFRVCAALSSVLLLASLSVALRSYWVADRLERLEYSFTADTSILRRDEATSAHGAIYIDLVWVESDAPVSADARPLWLSKNHLQYSHRYDSGSASDNFLYQGGRPKLGFGYHSTT